MHLVPLDLINIRIFTIPVLCVPRSSQHFPPLYHLAPLSCALLHMSLAIGAPGFAVISPSISSQNSAPLYKSGIANSHPRIFPALSSFLVLALGAPGSKRDFLPNNWQPCGSYLQYPLAAPGSQWISIHIWRVSMRRPTGHPPVHCAWRQAQAVKTAYHHVGLCTSPNTGFFCHRSLKGYFWNDALDLWILIIRHSC